MENFREDIRTTIAGNITELRKEAGLTQIAFAEKLNYSDKAVSKWERGESIPDIVVLKEIADLFSVTVDYLLKSEHSKEEKEEVRPKKAKQRNRFLISLGSIASVWLFATLLFTVLSYLPFSIHWKWQVFVHAVPVSAILTVIFNAIWGKKSLIWLTVLFLEWSILFSVFSVYAMFAGSYPWLFLFFGALMTVVTIIFCAIKKR